MFSVYLHQALALLVMMANSITTWRLLSYQRGTSSYHWHFSLLAWLLIVCTGTRAIDILLYLDKVAVTLGEAGVASLLCVLVCRVKGNIATLVRRLV